MNDWKDKPWRPKDVYREKQENNWLKARLLEHAEEMRQFSPVDFMSKPVDFMSKPVDKGDSNG